MLVSPRVAKLLASSALLVFMTMDSTSLAFTSPTTSSAQTTITTTRIANPSTLRLKLSYDPQENDDWLNPADNDPNYDPPPPMDRYVAPATTSSSGSVNNVLTDGPKQKESLVAPFGVGKDSTKRQLNTLWDEAKQKERNVASFGVGSDSTKRELRTLWDEPMTKERNVAPFRVGNDSTKRHNSMGPDRRTSGMLWHSVAEDTTKRTSAGPTNNNGSPQTFAVVGNDSTKRRLSNGPDRRDADSTQLAPATNRPPTSSGGVGAQMGDAMLPTRYEPPRSPSSSSSLSQAPPTPMQVPQEGTSTPAGMAVGGSPPSDPTWQAVGNSRTAQVKYYDYNYQAPRFAPDIPQEGTSTPAGTAVGGLSSEQSRRNRPRLNHSGNVKGSSSPAATSSPMDSVPAAPPQEPEPVVAAAKTPPPVPQKQQQPQQQKRQQQPPPPPPPPRMEEPQDITPESGTAEDDMNNLTPEQLKAVTQQLIQENMGLKQELDQQQDIYQRLEQRMANLEQGLGGGGGENDNSN